MPVTAKVPKGSTKSNKDPDMVAEQRLSSMEDSIEALEESVINLSGIKDGLEASMKEMMREGMEAMNKAVSDSIKMQVNKLDKLMETVQLCEQLAIAQSTIDKKFEELERNINDA